MYIAAAGHTRALRLHCCKADILGRLNGYKDSFRERMDLPLSLGGQLFKIFRVQGPMVHCHVEVWLL